jgi:hypothetical protein
MKKTRSAPSGATYKRDVRQGRLNEPDIAPNGANPVLVDRCYKDFAPPELGCPIVINPSFLVFFFAFLAIFCGYSKTSVNCVSLADAAKGGRRGGLSAIARGGGTTAEVGFVVKFYGTIRI